jgi:adenine-specific DNA-methyltransferase
MKLYNFTIKNKKFEIILGNPPYILYQFFDSNQRNEALRIMHNAGLKSNKLANAWVA